MESQQTIRSKTYLTFQLGNEVFAVDVQSVREVLDLANITKIPGVPEFMRGIINLRGKVVPVVDLRLKFGMAETEKNINTCIIVMEVGLGDEMTVIGALADSVQDVFEFNSDQIEAAPRFGNANQMEYIKGIGKRDDLFVIILNFDRIFSTDELVQLGTAEEMFVEQDENVPVTETEGEH